MAPSFGQVCAHWPVSVFGSDWFSTALFAYPYLSNSSLMILLQSGCRQYCWPVWLFCFNSSKVGVFVGSLFIVIFMCEDHPQRYLLVITVLGVSVETPVWADNLFVVVPVSKFGKCQSLIRIWKHRFDPQGGMPEDFPTRKALIIRQLQGSTRSH